MLNKLDRGEPLATSVAYPIQTWTFGDEPAMIFLAGEVVVDYAHRFYREFDAERLWLNAYSNDLPWPTRSPGNCPANSTRTRHPIEIVFDPIRQQGSGTRPYGTVEGFFRRGAEKRLIRKSLQREAAAALARNSDIARRRDSVLECGQSSAAFRITPSPRGVFRSCARPTLP
ncbi:MAG: hypothetical protein WD342_06310 [Verrucomicrobiales bacterium]